MMEDDPGIGLSTGFAKQKRFPGAADSLGAPPTDRNKFKTKEYEMDYTYNRVLKGVHIDEADKRVREALSTEGFGVLTEIDVKATMKKKIDVDMNGYRILGACNPRMANEAIGLEPRIGAMLPCNVILREIDGGTEINAIDPVASMAAVENPGLISVAGKVRDMLRKAVDEA